MVHDDDLLLSAVQLGDSVLRFWLLGHLRHQLERLRVDLDLAGPLHVDVPYVCLANIYGPVSCHLVQAGQGQLSFQVLCAARFKRHTDT